MKKDLIFEELSISDEVDNVGKYVISDILDTSDLWQNI